MAGSELTPDPVHKQWLFVHDTTLNWINYSKLESKFEISEVRNKYSKIDKKSSIGLTSGTLD